MDSSPTINYDSDPLAELELEGLDYRIDGGKQGTALCISTRAPGAWDWEYLGEAQWDPMGLRCKALPRKTREELTRALRAAWEDAP